MTDLINKLPTLGNPELSELLRLNHTTPEYRDAIVNEALARLLVGLGNRRDPIYNATSSPTQENKAENAYWAQHDI